MGSSLSSDNTFPIVISVEDFPDQIRAHRLFLLEAASLGIPEWSDNVIRNAIRRYLTIWFPHVASSISSKEKNRTLIGESSDPALDYVSAEPPFDVRWVWHCHLLNPLVYADFCRRRCDRLVPYRFNVDPACRERARAAGRRLWARIAPDEPYEVLPGAAGGGGGADGVSAGAALTEDWDRDTGYDLVKASRRQLYFYYNVMLPHFKDERFVERALRRYRLFVQLKFLHPHLFIVPMYDIDLVWHTHVLNAHAYERDLRAHLGYVMTHDDAADDSRLGDAFADTCRLWWQSYREPLIIAASVKRGLPPLGRLHPLGDLQLLNEAHQGVLELTIDSTSFSRETIAKNSSAWGPIFLPPSKSDSITCFSVSHSLKTSEGREMFTCKLIHVPFWRASIVQVFHNELMVAFAQSIGSEQLPTSSQVVDPNTCITLDQHLGDRAMLIKDCSGDWAIVRGRASLDTKSLALSLFPCSTFEQGLPATDFLLIPYFTVLNNAIQLAGVHIDFANGRLMVPVSHTDGTTEVASVESKPVSAQLIALAYTAALLHVFCEPVKEVSQKYSGVNNFLSSVGREFDQTPTNSRIYTNGSLFYKFLGFFNNEHFIGIGDKNFCPWETRLSKEMEKKDPIDPEKEVYSIGFQDLVAKSVNEGSSSII